MFHPWVGKIPWRRKWQPTLVFWPEKPHGQRSFGGLQSKWSEGVTDSTTKHTHTTGTGGRESVTLYDPQRCFGPPQTIRILAVSKYNQNRGLIHSSYSKKCPSFSGSEKSGLEMLNSHPSLCFQNWPVCPARLTEDFPWLPTSPGPHGSSWTSNMVGGGVSLDFKFLKHLDQCDVYLPGPGSDHHSIYYNAFYGSNVVTVLHTFWAVLQGSRGLETTDLIRIKRSRA